jgi:hypothetical protein
MINSKSSFDTSNLGNSSKENMMPEPPITVDCDVLVIGSGGAGLRAA